MTQPNDRLSGSDHVRIKQLQTQLDQAANPTTKAWFEAYLKGTMRQRKFEGRTVATAGVAQELPMPL